MFPNGNHRVDSPSLTQKISPSHSSMSQPVIKFPGLTISHVLALQPPREARQHSPILHSQMTGDKAPVSLCFLRAPGLAIPWCSGTRTLL